MGAPVVLIHGMWCNTHHLARLDELLSARTYQCHRPSLPDHEPVAGQPEAVAARSIGDYVQAVCDYIRAQQFTQAPVLMGHSMGALVAQLVAARVDTAALVLLTPAAPAGINAVSGKVLPFALSVFTRPGFWKRAHKITPERARRSAVNGLHTSHQEKIINSLVHESGRVITQIALWWADGKRPTAVKPAEVKCPVYVLSAGQDRLTPPGVVRKVAQHYANASHRHWPDRSHWVIDDPDTEDMVQEIDGWLRPVLARRNRTAVELPRVSRAS